MIAFFRRLPRYPGSIVRGLFDLSEPARTEHRFTEAEVARLQALTADPPGVDEQTWSDLLMPAYLERLTESASIFAKQWLYRALRRNGGADSGVYARACALRADAPALARRTEALACLREAGFEAADRLFGSDVPSARAWWEPWYWLAPYVVLLSAAAAFYLPLAWVATFAALFAMISVHVGLEHTVTRAEHELQSIQLLLLARIRLDGDDRAARLSRALAGSFADSVPFMKEYRQWFGLSRVKQYLKTRDTIDRERAYLRACFETCAQAEAELTLIRMLDTGVCPAERGALAFDAVRHPLLSDPLPATLALHGKGIFLTGRNGEGKSTLLRAVGLNLLVGRTLGYCHAARAVLPDLPVMASLQNEDSLLGGESLFVAELRRARAMLEAPPAVFLIDEIFRGTNHLDSVSAAAAVLDRLAQHGLVLVSSHNVILGPLLRHRLDSQCLARTASAIELAPGVLAQANALTLLAEQGLGDEVAANARRVADWLGQYLARPAEAEAVLAPG